MLASHPTVPAAVSAAASSVCSAAWSPWRVDPAASVADQPPSPIYVTTTQKMLLLTWLML